MSPMNNAQQKEKLTNAEKIKRSARALFSKYGYGSTTVRMIAKDAGLSAGQITAHFGSKEELFRQITEEIIEATIEAYNPIEIETEQLLSRNELTKKEAARLIERVIDLQIEYCLNPENRDKLMMLNVSVPESPIVEGSIKLLKNTVLNKIERLLAQLIQAYSKNKGYLRSRTISRAINGAIVSYAEHDSLLLDEVYLSKYAPHSLEWMKEHLKKFLIDSIDVSDMIGD